MADSTANPEGYPEGGGAPVDSTDPEGGGAPVDSTDTPEAGGALGVRARHQEALVLAGEEGSGKAKPCLYYHLYAGRGELTRLIAAAGGLDIDEVHYDDDDDEDHGLEEFGSPGSLPTFSHGRLKIAQSFAIETYVSSVAPNFTLLEPNHRAIDGMFCKIKEDMFHGLDDILHVMLDDKEKVTEKAADLVAVCEKWLPVVESRLPEEGFINALDFPTPADLAVFNIVESFMPFKAAYRIGGYDLEGIHPKLAAFAARVAEHPNVKEYAENSKTMAEDPFYLADLAKPGEAGQAHAGIISELAEETAKLWHAVDRPVPNCAIVWLHSVGETEVYWQELFEMYGVLHLKELGECRWIMPRADPSPCTAREGALTFQWFDTREYPVCLTVPGAPDRKREEEDPDQIREAIHRVHEAVLALEVEGVPAEHIMIAGFGQGGALALHSALCYPKHLAGCVMLSGYIPCHESLLVPSVTPAGKTCEVLWLHGIEDAVVQIDAATSQAKALIELGVSLDFRLSFDYGHETTEEELKIFRDWLCKRIGQTFFAHRDGKRNVFRNNVFGAGGGKVLQTLQMSEGQPPTSSADDDED